MRVVHYHIGCIKSALVLWLCMSVYMSVHSQGVLLYEENFNQAVVSCTSVPHSAWRQCEASELNTSGYMWAEVPSLSGDSVVLEFPMCDFSMYAHVQIRFRHICKVSPADEARLEYRIDAVGSAGAWKPMPLSAYRGTAAAGGSGFSAADYVMWNAGDSLVMPLASWWAYECYDLSNEVSYDRAQFRLVLKKHHVPGSNISYGWLLDDFQVWASAGSMDCPIVQLLSPIVKDTVYAAGPHTVYAKVKASAGGHLLAPQLTYTSRPAGGWHADSLLMTAYAGDTMYKADIPAMEAGSQVVYAVTGSDSSGNHTTALCGYTVCKPMTVSGNIEPYVIGDTVNNGYSVADAPTGSGYGAYQWCRMLYRAEDMPDKACVINRLSFKVARDDRSLPLTGQKIYMRLTHDTDIASCYYENPAGMQADMVWEGIADTLQDNVWLHITLNTPYVYRPGMSLLIYWESRSPQSVNMESCRFFGDSRSSANAHLCVLCGNNGVFPTMGTGGWSVRPAVVFTIRALAYGEHSAAVDGVVSPVQSMVSGIKSLPVKVLLRNKGNEPLSSVTFHWSINGVEQSPHAYTATRALAWDFTDTVTIGNYVPVAMHNDTITVWVAMPNGYTDNVKYDDTVSTCLYGCSAPLAGTYTIGPHGYFHTLAEAVSVSNKCGAQADVRFVIASDHYAENADLSLLGHNYGPYTLTITADTGKAVYHITEAVQASDIRNVHISNIIFRAAGTGTMVIHNAGHVQISGCEFHADTLSRNADLSVLSMTGVLQQVTLSHNVFTGGYAGVEIEGSSTNPAQVEMYKNTIQKFYYSGINATYAHIILKNNYLNSRSYDAGSNVMMLYAYRVSGSIIANTLWQGSKASIYTYGMYLYGLHVDSAGVPMLIANNEISTYTTGAYYGIYVAESECRIVHNSIHVESAGQGRALQIADHANNAIEVCANDLVCNHGYPVYISGVAHLHNIYMCANNLEGDYIGYASGNIVTLADWQAMMHEYASVSVSPTYADSAVSLRWTSYSGVLVEPYMATDIQDSLRPLPTAVGAYAGGPVPERKAVLRPYPCLFHYAVAGTADTIKVVLLNAGCMPIDTARISWSVNGVMRTSLLWQGHLALMQADTITLGIISHTPGSISLQACVSIAGYTDTMLYSAYVCPSAGMAGTYTVGHEGDFVTLTQAVEALRKCGMSDSVTLSLLPGTYYEMLDLTYNNQYNHNYPLRITSQAGCADSVILSAGGMAVKLGHTHYVTLDHITIYGGDTYGIFFADTCTCISVTHCHILCSTTTTSASSCPIYKPLAANRVDSVSIAHNTITGGYYGVCLYGGRQNHDYGTAIVLDSNIITDQYYYATYFYYSNFSSCNGNIISSRNMNVTSYWYGLCMYYCNAKILNNTIYTRHEALNYAYGIYGTNMNIYDNSTADSALIANNVIYLNPCGTYATGIYVNGYYGEILHNSMYKQSSSGGNYGIAVVGTGNMLRIKNNNIDGNWAYCIYMGRRYNALTDDIDANNMRSGNGSIVAYVNGGARTMAAWKSIVLSDKHSVLTRPHYEKEGCLYLADTMNMGAAILPQLLQDKDLRYRGSFTCMGAYHYGQYALDAKIESLYSLPDSCMPGTTIPIKAVIANAGTDTLRSLQVQWSINGVYQPACLWQGTLPAGARDTLTLSIFPFVKGVYHIQACVTMPNSLPDAYHVNDTVSHTVVTCMGSLSGYYTVGTGGDFENIAAAWQTAMNCGVSGPVIFALTGDVNMDHFTFTTLPGSSSANIITITSATPQKITLTASTDPVLLLRHVSNITFRNLIIGTGTGGVVVKFGGMCRYITIDSCEIYGRPHTMNAADRTIEAYFAPMENNALRNITLSHNIISGGHSNIYFYYASGSASYMRHDCGIAIYNNVMTQAYAYGLYAYYYGYFTRISGNTIISRPGADSYSGICLYNYTTCEQLANNKIHIHAQGNAYGIYPYTYHNSSAVYGALAPDTIANNEVIVCSDNGAAYGVYVGSMSMAVCCHNSVYVQAPYAYALYKDMSESGYKCDVINNNLYAALPACEIHNPACIAYASYITRTTCASAIYGLNDYNNYYVNTGTYIACVEGTPMCLADMRTLQDMHSYNADPCYTDTYSCLRMPDTTRLLCPAVPGVTSDIAGFVRAGSTPAGAYELTPYTTDVALVKLNLNDTSATICPVLHFVNAGTDSLYSLTCAIVYNGVQLPPQTIYCSLASLQHDTCILPAVQAKYGKNTLQVYVTSVNGQPNDHKAANDTITLCRFRCNTPMSGTYVVGADSGAHFASFSEVYEALHSCMAADSITLQVQNGRYNEIPDMGAWAPYLGNHSMLITSLSGDSSQVIIGTPTAALWLNNNSHITFSHITLYSHTSATVTMQGSNNNITFSHCAVINDDTATSLSYGIYAPGTGRQQHITIQHCLISGGGYGVYLYAGSGTTVAALGNNISITHNEFYGQTCAGISITNAELNTLNNNIIIAKKYGQYMQWTGIDLYAVNGPVTANIIRQPNAGIAKCYGLHARYYGYHNTADLQLISNNVIALHGSEQVCGVRVYFVRTMIYHNSIRVQGGSPVTAVEVENAVWVKVRNNVLDAPYGCPVVLPADVECDYNAYGTTGTIGCREAYYSNLNAWQQAIHGDAHSLQCLPQYADTILLVPADAGKYVCPLQPEVPYDISNASRTVYTCMGAHNASAATIDVAALELSNMPAQAVHGQPLPVTLKVVSMGDSVVHDMCIGWSVNGVPQPPVQYNCIPSMHLHDTAYIHLGTAYAPMNGTADIQAWISTINNSPDICTANDTAACNMPTGPLAYFMSPMPDDTSYTLSFIVRAHILNTTGAITDIPMLNVETRLPDGTFLSEGVPMTQEANDEWFAIIPHQYYESTVIYTLPVTDTLGNSVVLQDSTYLICGRGMHTVQVGQGTVDNVTLPFNTCYNYGWSRSIYSAGELDAECGGGVITHVALQYVGGNISRDNIKLYMRAIYDTTETSYAYENPSDAGYTPVWTGNLPLSTGGWYTLPLQWPFTLPAGKHLQLYWEDMSGHYNCTYYFYNHATSVPQSAGGYSDESFAVAQREYAYTSRFKPNMKFTIGHPFEPYVQPDIAVSDILSPANNASTPCNTDYMPVTVCVQNMGDRNHDFATNNCTLYMLAQGPVTVYDSLRLDSGLLASGCYDTLTLFTALPVGTAGRYDITCWLNSRDKIPYDDTLQASYYSSRMYLPVYEDFHAGISPYFYVSNNNSSSGWSVVHDTDRVGSVPPLTGNAVMTFSGTRGVMSTLYSHQLDFGSLQRPALELWYYHDTAASVSDYTDVRISRNGNEYITLFNLKKNNGSSMGWTRYSYPLDSMVGESCVILQMEAMRKSTANYDGNQYIDCINIHALQDIAVAKVPVPYMEMCNSRYMPLQVELHNTTGQRISFPLTPCTLQVRVSGDCSAQYSVPLQQGEVPALGNRIVTVDSMFNFADGIYYVQAYVESPIDDYACNDTLYDTIIIQACLQVQAAQITGGNNNTDCIGPHTKVYEDYRLYNTGNVHMHNIVMSLHVYNASGSLCQVLYDTLYLSLPAGDSLSGRFPHAYTVPQCDMYTVELTAAPLCNTAALYSIAVAECVNMSDVEVSNILFPTDSMAAGTPAKIKVKVCNYSPYEDAKGIVIHACVCTLSGDTVAAYTETMNDIYADSCAEFEFPKPFSIPEQAYTIAVYVNNTDAHAANDTLLLLLHAIVDVREHSMPSLYLGQNMPNPAENFTSVPYSIPCRGRVTFSISNVAGQVLLTYTVYSAAGCNSFTLPIHTLPAGVYFYSMTFQGQRLVRKMVIKK